MKKITVIYTYIFRKDKCNKKYYLTGEMNLVWPQGLPLPQISAVHVHGDAKRAINRSIHNYLNIEIIAKTYELEDC